MGEFVNNGRKYPEGTVEQYFREGSNGRISQERENKVALVWKYRRKKMKRVRDREAN